MRTIYCWLLVAGAALAGGCGTPGDFRRVDVSSDLAPGTVSHFTAKAGARASAKIEEYSTGFPFWPFVWRTHETWADRDRTEGDGAYRFHVEDNWGLLLWTVSTSATGSYDTDGRTAGWSKGQSILLGAITNSSGEALRDGDLLPTSDFRLLWGLFEIEKTATGSGWRLFWIPL